MEHDNNLKYWCYNCQQQFQKDHQTEVCARCQSPAIEQIDNSNQNGPPSQFQVYQIANPPSNTVNPPPFTQNPVVTHHMFQFGPSALVVNSNGNQTQVQMRMGDNPFNMFNFGGFNQIFGQFGGIMNLINSLNGQSNLTAASPLQISRLQVVNRVPECSICQQIESQTEEPTNNEEKKGYKLRCSHCFHKNCISPWFEKTNTCPCCRERI